MCILIHTIQLIDQAQAASGQNSGPHHTTAPDGAKYALSSKTDPHKSSNSKGVRM